MNVSAWKVLNKDVGRKLVTTLTPVIYRQFRQYYLDAMEADEDTDDFYIGLMEEMCKWKSEDIQLETELIIQKVPNLGKYLKTFIISHIMTIASIRFGETPSSVDADVPPLERYIHAIMKDIAGEVQADPDLFNSNGSTRQVQQRKLAAVKLIRESIRNITLDMLPTDQMIADYVQDMADSQSESEEEVEEEEEEDVNENAITSDDLGGPENVAADDELSQEDQNQNEGTAETQEIIVSREAWTQPQQQQQQRSLMDGVEDIDLDE